MQGEQLSAEVIDAAVRVHKRLGPGLLETVYETVLAGVLTQAGLRVERQKPIDIEFEGMRFAAAFRVDLLIENELVVEIKSVEQISPVHHKQLLTYLRLLNQPVGLLLNFGGAVMKGEMRRVVNNFRPPSPSPALVSAPPRLRVKSDYTEAGE